MPFSRPILFPPATGDDSAAPTAPPSCPTNFFRCLETLVKEQQRKLLDTSTAMYGYDVCIYNPRIRISAYDDESQNWEYPLRPDYEGRVLITGLAQPLLFDGTDQWGEEQVTLYWNEPAHFQIKENAKLLVHTGDRQLSFKVKYLRKQIGAYTIYREVLQLIPWN